MMIPDLTKFFLLLMTGVSIVHSSSDTDVTSDDTTAYNMIAGPSALSRLVSVTRSRSINITQLEECTNMTYGLDYAFFRFGGDSMQLSAMHNTTEEIVDSWEACLEEQGQAAHIWMSATVDIPEDSVLVVPDLESNVYTWDQTIQVQRDTLGLRSLERRIYAYIYWLRLHYKDLCSYTKKVRRVLADSLGRGTLAGIYHLKNSTLEPCMPDGLKSMFILIVAILASEPKLYLWTIHSQLPDSPSIMMVPIFNV